jgi:hypothetical protein
MLDFYVISFFASKWEKMELQKEKFHWRKMTKERKENKSLGTNAR